MNKYKNKLVTYNGIKFHSIGECRRYQELDLMVKGKVITDLKLQPKYPITINDEKICNVIMDFEYIQNGIWILEDFKGFDTPVSKLKRKLLKAVYPSIEIRITTRRKK